MGIRDRSVLPDIGLRLDRPHERAPTPIGRQVPVVQKREGVTSSSTSVSDDQPLGRRAARGGAVQILGYALGRLPVLVATLVVARILAPDEFGVVAFALIIVGFLEAIHDLGVGQAIVYLPDERRFADSALAIAVAGSVVMTAAVWLVAPLIAEIFDENDVTWLLRVLSLTLILGAAAQVPDGLMRKRLEFTRRTVAILFRSFGRAAASIVLAVGGFGAFSIAYGYVIGDVLYLAATWVLSGYRPRIGTFSPERAAAREVVSFGAPVAIAVFVTGALFTIDSLFVGIRLGSGPVGLYTIAERIPDAAITRVSIVISGVAYPVFRAANLREGRLAAGYLDALRFQVAFVLFVAIGLASAGPALVPLVLGDDWQGATQPLRFLAFSAAGLALTTGAADVFKAVGRPRLVLWTMLGQLAVMSPLLWFAAGRSVATLAATMAVMSAMAAVLMHTLACKLIDVPLARAAKATIPPIVIGCALGGGMWVGRAFVDASDLITVVVQLTLGGLSGAVATAIVWRSLPGELRRLFGTNAEAPAATPTNPPERTMPR